MKVLALLILCSAAFGQVAVIDLGPTSTMNNTGVGGSHDVCFSNGGASTSPGTIWANFDFHALCADNLAVWATGTVDTKRDCLITKGGGHNNYPGNELFELCISGGGGTTGTMTRITDPDVWTPDIWGPSCGLTNSDVNPNGSPVAAHGYGQVVYIPDIDSVYQFGTFNSNACASARTFLLNMGNKTWAAKDPVCSGTCVVGGVSRTGHNPLTEGSLSATGSMCTWDSVTHTVWCNEIGTGLLLQYDPSTNAYYLASTSVPTFEGTTMQYDPLRKWLVFAGTNGVTGLIRIGYIDTTGSDSYAYHDLTASFSGCSGILQLAFPDDAWPGFVYDPVIGRFVVYPNSGNTLYLMDISERTCSTQTFSGTSIPTPPGVSSGSTNSFGKFNYLPKSGLYVLTNQMSVDAFAFRLNASAVPGLGSSTLTCVDSDGDGYGVGAGCTGPDADDNDAAVHTASDATTKYGSLANFVHHLGYNPSRLWYLSTSGNDGTCAVGTLASPPSIACATWAHVGASVVAGDMVMVRGGTFTAQSWTVPAGSTGSPVIVMAYPGELPIIDNTAPPNNTAIALANFTILDGFKVTGSLGSVGCVAASGTNNVVIRHLEATMCNPGGIDAFNNIVDHLYEYNSMHDFYGGICGSCQHAMYVGAYGAGISNKNIAVRRNILYKANDGYPAFQHNGPVTNLVFDQNWAYDQQGNATVSLLRGVSNSRVTNNKLWNNQGGINIANYDGDCYIGPSSAGICPASLNNNIVANNSIFAGYNWHDGTDINPQGLYVADSSTGCPPRIGDQEGWAASSTSFGMGYTILDSNLRVQTVTTTGTTGSTLPTWATSGTTTDGTVVWTAGSICTLTKQGTINGTMVINNVFDSVAIPSLYKNCTTATFPTTCALDTADTSLSTSTFINNTFWPWAVGSPGLVMATAPGASYTGHNLAAMASLWSASSTGNLNVNPQYTAANGANWATPGSFDLRPAAGSPLINGGVLNTPTKFDVTGNGVTYPPFSGAFQTAGGCAISPTVLGPWTNTQASGFGSLVASGCSSSTYACSGLPTGLTINASTGAITGTISASGTFTPSCTYDVATQPYTILVNAVPAITTSGAMPSVASGGAYSQSLSTSGGTAPLTCALFTGTLSGSGITLNSNCTVTGTAATVATYTFTAKATDLNGVVSVASSSISITVNPPVNLGGSKLGGKSVVNGTTVRK